MTTAKTKPLSARVRAMLGLTKTKSTTTTLTFPGNAGWPTDWFQRGMDLSTNHNGNSSVVEACISAYAQTVAQLPVHYYKISPDGARTELVHSSISRLLRRPNSQSTRSDFFLNLVTALMSDGNAYFIGDGDTPRKNENLYLLNPRDVRVQFNAPTADVFYNVGGMSAELSGMQNETGYMIPSRYVGHAKLRSAGNPLVGASPLTYAAASVSANNAIVGSQAAFFNNMSRPSGVLSTDMELTKDQITLLRDAWEAQSKTMNSGGVPILSYGLKWEALSVSNQDAQIIESWKMTIEDISRVYRVPPMLINNMQNSTFNNAEALMTFWLASGLGFVVDNVEQALSQFFNLPYDETIQFDTDVLLRTATPDRYTALGNAITKGLISPNEARAKEGLPPVDGGELPLRQLNTVPLDTPVSSASGATTGTGANPFNGEDDQTVGEDT